MGVMQSFDSIAKLGIGLNLSKFVRHPFDQGQGQRMRAPSIALTLGEASQILKALSKGLGQCQKPVAFKSHKTSAGFPGQFQQGLHEQHLAFIQGQLARDLKPVSLLPYPKPELLSPGFSHKIDFLAFGPLDLKGVFRQGFQFEKKLEGLLRRLEQGKLVCLVADRDLSGSGVPVDFFGETASMPAGPAMLSLLTGAPLMPVELWHVEGGLNARVRGALPHPVGVERKERSAVLTQAVADSFARSIREHPADWHMMQRLWLSDLPQRVAS